jgi:hypothetical protein
MKQRTDSCASESSRSRARELPPESVTSSTGRPPRGDSFRQDSCALFEMPAAAGDAHPKVLRALKLMRDIHWDTSGADVGSNTATEYTPVVIRNIDDIKRDARLNLLKITKVGRSYHIGRINDTSRFLRPNSANAILVSEVCQGEEERRKLKRKMRRMQSQTLNASPDLSLNPSPIGTGRLMSGLPPLGNSFQSAGEDFFEDVGPADDAAFASGERPLSGTVRPSSALRKSLSASPKNGEIPGSGRRRPGSGDNAWSTAIVLSRPEGGTRPGSGQRPISGQRPNSGPNSSIRRTHSTMEGGKAGPKADNKLTKSKSFDVRPKLSKEDKEKAIMAKIAEKRLRVEQKQLDLERIQQQMLWMKIVVYLSRLGLVQPAMSLYH